MSISKLRDLSLIVFCLTISLLLLIQNARKNESQTRSNCEQEMKVSDSNFLVRTRDFMRYECRHLKRIGGHEKHIKNAPHPLYRLDGAWFVCADERVGPKKSDCVVMSFGVRDDFSFDKQMSNSNGEDEFDCRTFSFDPHFEAALFSEQRLADKRLVDSIEIRVNRNWKFYSIGISHRTSRNDFKALKIGDLANWSMIIQLTGLENRVIDVLKMDIEGSEKSVLAQLDMNYACKYIKQLMFESHGNMRFGELVKLEACFSLFRRDTRFFQHNRPTPELGLLTEFQLKQGFDLNLKYFDNETSLAEYMFANGELYFLNRNFF